MRKRVRERKRENEKETENEKEREYSIFPKKYFIQKLLSSSASES